MADVVEEAIDLSQHFESEGETDLIIAEDDEEEPEIGDDDDVCQEMLVPIVEITEDTVILVADSELFKSYLLHNHL